MMLLHFFFVHLHHYWFVLQLKKILSDIEAEEERMMNVFTETVFLFFEWSLCLSVHNSFKVQISFILLALASNHL